jgi:hypothetical protein
MTPEDVDAVMAMIPSNWRKRWCDADICACLGCVNRSGMSRVPPDFRITKEEWRDWVDRNGVKQ